MLVHLYVVILCLGACGVDEAVLEESRSLASCFSYFSVPEVSMTQFHPERTI